MKRWRAFRYKNLSVVILSLFIAFLLSRSEVFHLFLLQLGNLGHVGALVAGMLYASVFTVGPGALIILTLAEELSLFEICIIAGLGGLIGDLLIFRFIKDNLTEEIMPIYHHLGGRHLKRMFQTKYTKWLLPIIGALIIASPFPDEVGISLMGISKMKNSYFILVSFTLNVLGIFGIVTASEILIR